MNKESRTFPKLGLGISKIKNSDLCFDVRRVKPQITNLLKQFELENVTFQTLYFTVCAQAQHESTG